MKTLQTFIFVCILSLVMPAHAVDAPFDRLQDNAWALVLTGPIDDPLYIEQMALLAPEAKTLIEREIVVIHFKDRSLNLFPELSVFPYQLPVLRENRDTNLLESLLMTDDDLFSVALVGKDGITKYVWKIVVKPEDIFSIMDHPVTIPQEIIDQAPK